jgi:uncharacterized protein YozE (UPF0346 family)
MFDNLSNIKNTNSVTILYQNTYLDYSKNRGKIIKEYKIKMAFFNLFTPYLTSLTTFNRIWVSILFIMRKQI